MTFAVHANRMKPFFDPTLRPIDPPLEDDPNEPYLDEVDIPEDCFEAEKTGESSVVTVDTSAKTASSQSNQQKDYQNVQSPVDPEGVVIARVIDNQIVFRAEKILKCRRNRGNTEYFVKWYGYPRSQSTWEPEENILDKRLLENVESSRK